MRVSTSDRVEKLDLYKHSVFKVPKKFSMAALSYGHPGLDIDGVKWYCSLRSKYALDVY